MIFTDDWKALSGMPGLKGGDMEKIAACLKARSEDRKTGHFPLDGERLFCNVNSYETKPREQIPFEAHRRYADVQLLLSGEETVEVAPLQSLKETDAYEATRDAGFYQGTCAASLHLVPGRIAVFYPADAHRPCIQTAGPCQVLKVVVKIALD